MALCNEYCQAHTCNYAKCVNVNREAEHYQRGVTYIPHKAECIVAPHKLFFRKSPCYSRQKTKQNNYFLLSGLSHAAADVTKAYIVFIFYYFNEMLSIACVFVATRLATLYADLCTYFLICSISALFTGNFSQFVFFQCKNSLILTYYACNSTL